MKRINTYCEPYSIQKGYNFEIHYVSYNEQDEYSCFMHFHEVHELIIFENIEGSYHYNQGESELQDFDMVFTSALETHDFSLSQRHKSWYIIQFLPSVLTESGLINSANQFFKQGMHLRLVKSELDKIKQLVSWLLESYTADPYSDKSQTLLYLLLSWVAESGTPLKVTHLKTVNNSAHVTKLQPVIKRFSQQQCVDLSLEEAAKLCFLSTSYFSRLFKKVFHYNYSEYSVRHRLYIATRLLSQSEKSITEISYELNFSSPSHFIAQFKKQFDITPKKYKLSLLTRSSQ